MDEAIIKRVGKRSEDWRARPLTNGKINGTNQAYLFRFSDALKNVHMSSNLDPTESDSFVLDGSSDDKSKFLCFYVGTNWQIKDYVCETFTVEHKILWIKVVGYYDSFGRCNDPYYHHTPLPDRTNEERTRQSKDTSLRAVTLTSQCLQLS